MRLTSVILLVIASFSGYATQHPNLILTSEGVNLMRASLGQVPLFDATLATVRTQVDAEIAAGIDVPIPKDLAGGYTHERHKANFFTMQKAGVLFQITQDEKYAVYIRDMLLQYAEIFPTIGKHPAERSYARGKFFWQCLNDANWLVYTSQAYDCIYDWLDDDTVEKLNNELFRPYADYISIENPQFFNRIHNHSTWGNAGVGMIGLVMDDEELVNRALYGLDMKVPGDVVKDNDGGSIQLKGQKEAGFLAQIDHAFSPDGYYTEGPYYQRYAMYPFLIFSMGLANKKTELDILNYRDGLLIKAVYALINQTTVAGEFFPINDAQKGMSLQSRELVNAISMAYYYGDKDPELLSLIENQGRVPLNDSGLAAASAISKGEALPYEFKSIYLTDGASGTEGGIAILRNKDITLVLKNAKHGMGHGHFDRLSFLLYSGEKEVFQDYGSARWVNIDHKDGGGYLKENNTWAKQTIAHNSVVINRESQFGGNVQRAEESHGTPVFFDVSNLEAQVVSSQESDAYSNWTLNRTMAVLEINELEHPLVLDLFSVMPTDYSQEQVRIELPLYYKGELLSTNGDIQAEKSLSELSDHDGYQHLWKEATSIPETSDYKMTWFNGKEFYSVTAETHQDDEIIYTRIGANDPAFNLRRDPGLLLARTTSSTLFAQAYEIHGFYDPAAEIPVNSFSSIKEVKTLHHSNQYNAVEITLASGDQYIFCHRKGGNDNTHSIELESGTITWNGNFYFSKI